MVGLRTRPEVRIATADEPGDTVSGDAVGLLRLDLRLPFSGDVSFVFFNFVVGFETPVVGVSSTPVSSVVDFALGVSLAFALRRLINAGVFLTSPVNGEFWIGLRTRVLRRCADDCADPTPLAVGFAAGVTGAELSASVGPWALTGSSTGVRGIASSAVVFDGSPLTLF